MPLSPSERAEARRKAILSRGSDRLNKLTTSARGEHHPAYVHDDPPLPSIGKSTAEKFLGEETDMPTPPRRTPPPSAFPVGGEAPSAWTPEQQQEILRTFMGGGTLPGLNPPGLPGQPTSIFPDNGSQAPPFSPDDPMAAMMTALSQFTGQTPPGGAGSPFPTQADAPRTRTKLQKVMPLIHLATTWFLLAYFVLFREPEAYEKSFAEGMHVSGAMGMLQRWGEMGWRDVGGGFGVQTVPFFWAFVTMQLVLHSVQLFTKTNPLQPPMLVAMALPYLPPPFPSLIINGLSYFRMGGMLLDDIAGFVVGVGLLILVSGWLTGV